MEDKIKLNVSDLVELNKYINEPLEKLDLEEYQRRIIIATISLKLIEKINKGEILKDD